MHLVTDGHDPELISLLFDVYVNEAGANFRLYQEEYTIYIRLYTYFCDRYAELHIEPDSRERFMERFVNEGLPAYHEFLDEVIDLLDRFHLTYEYVETSGKRMVNLTKGGFGCAL